MTYSNNIPLPNQSLGVTQPDINTNFALIKSGFDTDHLPFDAATAAGRHKYVRLVDGNVPTTVNGQMGLFNKQKAGRSTLYMKIDGTLTQTQLTGSDPTNYTFSNANYAMTASTTFLAGGFQLTAGSINIKKAAQPITVTFPVAFANPPFVTATAYIGALPDTTLRVVYFGTITSTTAEVFFSTSDNTTIAGYFSFMAMGGEV